MAGAPIDIAYVAIEPDFSKFQQKSDTEIKDAFAEIDPSVRALIDSIEHQFEQLGTAVGEIFQEMSASAGKQLEQLDAIADNTSKAIANDFSRQGENVERSLEEISRRANTEFDKVGRDADQAGKKMSGGFGGGLIGGLALTSGIAAIGSGLVQVTKSGLQSAASLEQVKVAFSALTGSVAAGNQQFADLQKFAAATPFTFNDLTVGAQRFDAFSKTVGMSQAQLIPFLTTIGNLVSETGGGAQSLDTITLALGQTASQGKLTLGNLDQINNAIPGFSSVAALAAVRGQTTAEVMDQISAGTIDATTGIQQLIQGMNQFPGAAGAMEKQSQTLLGVWSTFTDTLGQSLSNAFTPVIPAIKDSLTQLTPILGDAIGQIAPALGTVLSSLLPVLAGLVQGIAPILGPLLTGLSQGLAAIGPVFASLGTALAPLAQALAPILAFAGQLIAVLAQALMPIIAALMPAVTSLLGAVMQILQPLLPIITMIGSVLAGVLAPIMNVLVMLFTAIGPPIAQLVAAIGQALSPLLNALIPIVQTLLDALAPLWPTFGLLLQPIIQLVVALTPLIDIIAQLLVIAVDIIAPIIQLAATLISLLDTKALAPLLMLIAQALTLILAPLEKLTGPLASFDAFIHGINWASVGKDIAGAFVAGWNAVVNFFQGIPHQIASFLNALPGMLVSLAQNAFNLFFQAIGFGIGMIIAEFLAFPGQVWAIITWLWDTSIQLTVNGIQMLISFVMQIGPKILQFFGQARDNATSTISDLVSRVVAYIHSLPGRIVDELKALPGQIQGALAGAGQWLYDAGTNIIMGLINGIKGAVGMAVNAVKNAMGDVIKGAKNALGQKSPSTVFRDIGKNTVAGYGQGVDENADIATSAINNLVTPPSTISKNSHDAIGGVTFGAGAITVNLGPGATPADAYAAGQQVAQGITDTLTAQARSLAQRPRTI